MPKKFSRGYNKSLEGINKQLNGFFSVKMVESLIIASICSIGFLLAGIPGWLFLGLMTGLFNTIPYLGPIVGAIPPLVVGLLISPITALYALLTVLFAQGIDNFYIIPFMIPRKVKIDSLLSIILFIIFAQLFGVLGMILSIPVFLVYKVVLVATYDELVKIYNTRKKFRV